MEVSLNVNSACLLGFFANLSLIADVIKKEHSLLYYAENWAIHTILIPWVIIPKPHQLKAVTPNHPE